MDFAKECCCGETTWRRMEAGQPIAGATLQAIAAELKIHWHDLLSEAERKRLGLGRPSASLPMNATPAAAISPPGSRLFQLPPVPPDFIGREELIRDLTHRLGEDAGRAPLAALRGMGGAGKTSLAIRVAHEVKNWFPDAQLFLKLRGTADGVKEHALTPAEAMPQVIRAFRPDAIDLPGDEDALAGVYRGDLAGKRSLILLDNAANEAQLRPLLTAPLPVRFLITCRHVQALDGVESIHVEGLPPEEAFSLLRRIMGHRGTRRELQELVRLCAGLPLALRVAGDFLRLKEDWPVSRYVAALQSEPHRWLKVGADPEKDVEAVLKLSAALLVRDSVERGARWHLLHIFDGDFDVPTAAAVWHADENDLGVLHDLSDLENRSLITFDQNTRRYHLHDLLRPIAQGLFGGQGLDGRVPVREPGSPGA